jgi:hypothetical protein
MTAEIINYTGEDYEMAGRVETVRKVVDSTIGPGNHRIYIKLIW